MTIGLIEGLEVGAGNRLPSTGPICPLCGLSFTPRRRNQRYCVPACQKKASKNNTRGSQRAADNPEAKRLAEMHRRRAELLVDALYGKPPDQRPAFMEIILTAAREHDWHLRRILTDRRSLAVFRGHSGTGRPTLARALDDYCQRSRGGVRVWQVVAEGWVDQPNAIRPLALYRDPWTNVTMGLEGPSEVHVQRDTKAFLAQLKVARLVASGGGNNPPSCSI